MTKRDICLLYMLAITGFFGGMIVIFLANEGVLSDILPHSLIITLSSLWLGFGLGRVDK